MVESPMIEQEMNQELDVDEEQKIKKEKIPKLALFYSHCFIPLLVLIAVIVGITLFVTMNTCGPYKSAEIEFNSSILPSYIVQISDLHFNHKKPKETEKKLQLFKNIKNNLNPDILVFIGDIIHASNSTSEISYHRNYQENWDVFNKTLTESGLNDSSTDTKILYVAGNHDEFAIPKDTTKYHPFRRLFLKDDETPFILNSIQINNTEGSLPFNFVLFNPIYPPAPTGPMNVSPFVKKEHVDELETLILENHINILVSHYPLISLWSNTDSTGKNIKNVIEKFDLMMSGHLHPKEPIVYKHKDLVNVVSCKEVDNSDNTTVYTIDNNMISSHNIDISKDNRLLITYPISEESITSKTSFNKKSFDVRVLSLSNDQKQDIKVNIDGIDYGSMKFVQEARKEVQFYSLPINNLNEGRHLITVSSGNSTYSMWFYIGEEYELKHFSWYFDAWFYHPYLNIIIAGFTALYSIIRIIPLWKIQSIKKIVDIYDSYLFDSQNDENVLNKKQVFFYSLLDYITRYRNLPITTYLTLFIDTILVFFVPLYITKLDTTNGVFFAWGIVIEGKVSYDSFNYTVWMLYNVLFLLPLGSFAVFMRYKITFYCESFFYILLMTVNICSTIIIGCVLGDLIGIFGSPLLYIIIISYTLIVSDIFRENNNVNVMKSIQNALLSNCLYTV